MATAQEANPTNPAFLMQKTFVVAQYTGPGNYMGQYLDNVLALKNGGNDRALINRVVIFYGRGWGITVSEHPLIVGITIIRHLLVAC